MEVSKESLYDDDDKERDPDLSPVSQIFRIIKDMANDLRGAKIRPRKRAKRMGKGPEGQREMDADDEEEAEEELSLVDVRARVLAAGFTEVQLQECLIEVRFVVLSTDDWQRLIHLTF